MNEKPPLLDRPMFILALLALATAALLTHCWRAPFYEFDDYDYVYLAVEDTWTSWKPASQAHDPFHPLLFLEFGETASLRLDYALFGKPRPADKHYDELKAHDFGGGVVIHPAPDNAWAPAARIMNGVYHLIAAFILWLLLRRLGAGAGIAAFVAIVWAGHPMACESVCWIAERKNVLSAVFGFASLLAWSAPWTWRWRLPLAWLLYLFALFSKPTALGLLPLFAAIQIVDPAERRFSWSNSADWIALLRAMIVPVALSVGVILLSVLGIARDMVQPPGGSVWTAILTDSEICARYIMNLIAPIDIHSWDSVTALQSRLSFFYAVDPIVSLGDARLWAYGFGLAAFAAALIWAAGPLRRHAMLGLVWFVAVLGPSWNLMAIPDYMQDRYTYLAAPGMILAIACAAQGLLARLKRPAIQWLCASAVVLLMVCASSVHSEIYTDETALLLDAAKQQPRTAQARRWAAGIFRKEYERHGSLGTEPDPKQEQMYLSAIVAQYKGALDCPDVENYFEVFNLRAMLAEFLVRQNRIDEALSYLDGWLPPKHMTLLPESGIAERGTRNGYMPQTLAYAWLVVAEARRRESLADGLTPEQRTAKCREALDDAEKSLAVHLNDYKAYVLKARIHIRLSEIEKESADPDAARKDLTAARALLREVPPESERAPIARLLLERLPAE